MQNTLKAASLFAALGLLTVLLPAPAAAEKSRKELCKDQGGDWHGVPEGAVTTGYCDFSLLKPSLKLDRAKCRVMGGTVLSGKCRLSPDALDRFVRQAPR